MCHQCQYWYLLWFVYENEVGFVKLKKKNKIMKMKEKKRVLKRKGGKGIEKREGKTGEDGGKGGEFLSKEKIMGKSWFWPQTFCIYSAIWSREEKFEKVG